MCVTLRERARESVDGALSTNRITASLKIMGRCSKKSIKQLNRVSIRVRVSFRVIQYVLSSLTSTCSQLEVI